MTRPRGGWGRVLTRTLALAALGFIAWTVPVRDRCWDPRAPESTRVTLSRDDAGCVLHLRSGDTRITPSECAALRCEPGVGSVLSHVRFDILGGLLVVYALGTLAWAARWRALLGFAGVDLPVWNVWRISIEAQAGGVVLPGGLGGDALRVAAVLSRPERAGEARAPASIVVASVLLDRAVGLALVSTVAVVLGELSGGVGGRPVILALSAVPVVLVAALWSLRALPFERLERFGQGRLGRLLAPLFGYARDPRAPAAIARAALLSLAVAGTQFAVVRGLVWALGVTPGRENWVYVGTAMAFIVGAVPALPGGWGTSDAAFVFFFGLAGIAAPIALAVSLLYRLFWYLSGVMGAILYMARRKPPEGLKRPA
ncbi:MAG TPA: lysylphosphatidylglycerol synthase transmembrane domain-containing protein [Polyangiaceae bacterium]|nr:lysylphosphatidylglycerol synthase transmembrane domain-containing protein [Polyangiaceae bacterium]